jgi:SMC interacting uncharacterized protein involved in chromosome segregation
MGLSDEFQDNPQLGWQRFEDKTELIEENIKLRKEIDRLKTENITLNKKISTNKPEIDNIVGMTEDVYIRYNAFIQYLGVSEQIIKVSLDEVFLYIAYDLKEAKWESDFIKMLIKFLGFKTNNVDIRSINKESYESLILTLQAYKLIDVGTSASKAYVHLSETGKQYLISQKVLKTSKASKFVQNSAPTKNW